MVNTPREVLIVYGKRLALLRKHTPAEAGTYFELSGMLIVLLPLATSYSRPEVSEELYFSGVMSLVGAVDRWPAAASGDCSNTVTATLYFPVGKPSIRFDFKEYDPSGMIVPIAGFDFPSTGEKFTTPGPMGFPSSVTTPETVDSRLSRQPTTITMAVTSENSLEIPRDGTKSITVSKQLRQKRTLPD
jgi:hypothetical protein